MKQLTGVWHQTFGESRGHIRGQLRIGSGQSCHFISVYGHANCKPEDGFVVGRTYRLTGFHARGQLRGRTSFRFDRATYVEPAVPSLPFPPPAAPAGGSH